MPVRVVPRSLTEAYKKREGDFAPNLVGFQATKAPLFTLGNFAITTNLEGKFNKSFDLGGEWSDYYSLDNLNLTEEESKLLESNQIFIDLNYDISRIDRYAHFGSLTEFVRVNIEQIILGWKGSLYMNKNLTEPTLNTVLTYNYDNTTNISTFKIPTSSVINNFNLIYEDNESFTTEVSDISNLKNSYDKYFLWNEFGSFIILNYGGSSSSDPYIQLEVYGEAWPPLTGTTFGSYNYHIRPLPEETDKFFLRLTDFQKVMLNRLITPKYTLELEIPYENEDGNVINERRTFSWPTSDGYNLDINGFRYSSYIDNLFESTQQYDRLNSDLVSRKFVSASIHEFDTPGDGTNDTGQKVQKLLRIYGREFDDIKKYIDGISFANVVTYNKRDNTSDELIKMMAKTLGLDVLETIFGNDFNLMDYNSSGDNPQFAAFSREYSPKEIEIEFWRRLVINAWWLWKSKGTRKVLEFFLKLFGVSDDMIDLDEYVYIAGNRLNTSDVLQQIEDYFDLVGNPREVVLEDYPIDVYGYPRVLPNSEDYWYHMEGGWYNGGTENTVGNNPHFGPYDYGSKYINKFKQFIDDQITTVTGDTTTTVQNLFSGYGNEVLGDNIDVVTVTNGDTQVIDAQNSRKYTFSTVNCDPCEGITVTEILEGEATSRSTATFSVSAPVGSSYIWTTTGANIVEGQGTDTIIIDVISFIGEFELGVTVTNGECVITKTKTLNYGNQFVEVFTCDITVTPTTNSTSDDGVITVTMGGGVKPYHINIDGVDNQTNDNTFIISELTAGDTYNLTVSDSDSNICALNEEVLIPNGELNIEDVLLYQLGFTNNNNGSQILTWYPYKMVNGIAKPLTEAERVNMFNIIHINKQAPTWFSGNGVYRANDSRFWGSGFSVGEIKDDLINGVGPNSCWETYTTNDGFSKPSLSWLGGNTIIRLERPNIEVLGGDTYCEPYTNYSGCKGDCYAFTTAACFRTTNSREIQLGTIADKENNPQVYLNGDDGAGQTITTNIILEELILPTGEGGTPSIDWEISTTNYPNNGGTTEVIVGGVGG